MNKVNVSLIQLCSDNDKKANLQKAQNLIEQAVAKLIQNDPDSLKIPHLICLPEVFNFRSTNQEENYLAAESIPDGETFAWAAKIAKNHNIWLIAGSILENPESFLSSAAQVSKDTTDLEASSEPSIPEAFNEVISNKPFNTSFALNPNGELIAKYRKINLFQLRGGEKNPELCEPLYRSAGLDKIYFDTPFGRIGLAICFDLRFPEIFSYYRKQNCDLIVLPSAFTYITGKDHWEILCRARAIENQVFLIAPNQSTNSKCWGQSMIVDPWGEILANLNQEAEGFITNQIDIEEVKKTREKLPISR